MVHGTLDTSWLAEQGTNSGISASSSFPPTFLSLSEDNIRNICFQDCFILNWWSVNCLCCGISFDLIPGNIIKEYVLMFISAYLGLFWPNLIRDLNHTTMSSSLSPTMFHCIPSCWWHIIISINCSFLYQLPGSRWSWMIWITSL